MKTRRFAYPYGVWIILFTLAPLGLLLYYSLISPNHAGITLANFQKFTNPIYVMVLVRSILLALVCTVICLLIAYPVAYILAKQKKGAFLSLLFILPMWMNFLLRTYAWMTILENTGIINKLLGFIGLPQASLMYNTQAVIMGMVYNFLPFMILPLYTSLQKMDPALIEGAQDLGANPTTVFRRITLPLSMPGIVSGITMVFMPAVTTFVISRLLGGSQFMMFGDLIEQQFLTNNNWNFGAALSLIMMVIMLLSMAVMNHFNKGIEGRALL